MRNNKFVVYLFAPQRAVQVGSMVAVIREIFIVAHSESSLSDQLKNKSRQHDFLTPVEGFLRFVEFR